MDRYIRIGIIAGALWSISGLVLLLSKIAPRIVSVPFFDTGVLILGVSLVYAYLRRYRKDSLICDERSMHIVMYSLAYSWFITLSIAVALFYIYLLNWLTFSIPMILVVWILSMTISGFLIYLLLTKRGTIE
jgi:hypothetical protein